MAILVMKSQALEMFLLGLKMKVDVNPIESQMLPFEKNSGVMAQ